MSYLFDPRVLHDIATRVIGLPHEEMADRLVSSLTAAYPGHIETRQDWIFSNAGGALGIMNLLHGSLSEYLLILGTAVGTEGYSGRYRLDIYDAMLSGEMWTYSESDFRRRQIYRPGDMALLARREVKGFRLMEDTWMLEYGRGLVPTALPMALSGAVVSLDARTIFKTIWNYGRAATRELLRGKL